MGNEINYEDFKIIAPGKPIIIMRHWIPSGNWIVFFEHEQGQIATYQGQAKTQEAAMDLFIRFRINDDRVPMEPWDYAVDAEL